MSKWETKLIDYLTIASEELRIKKRYYQRIRMMFEELYRMIVQKRSIEQEINLLNKLNIQSNRHNQQLTNINDNIREIRQKLGIS
jgi:hypothetical protein